MVLEPAMAIEEIQKISAKEPEEITGGHLTTMTPAGLSLIETFRMHRSVNTREIERFDDLHGKPIPNVVHLGCLSICSARKTETSMRGRMITYGVEVWNVTQASIDEEAQFLKGTDR